VKVIHLSLIFCFSLTARAAPSGQVMEQKQEPAPEERIVTPEEVDRAVHPNRTLPLRILFYPHRVVSSGMEKGLVSFESHHMRERIQLGKQYLLDRGIIPLFGGLGEGAGFGGGAIYRLYDRENHGLQFLGRASFKGYQEAELQWKASAKRLELSTEASYQWRPQENFYGLGHDSNRLQRTDFALRQTWVGARIQVQPTDFFQLGSCYKHAWLSTRAGTNPAFSSPDDFFSELPGYGRQIRLRSIGLYSDLISIPRDYDWGGAAHVGASYQRGVGNRVRYFSYEAQLEGRLPVIRDRSALVGQASIELNRERHGSEPLPFFLQPHIGGSSTLRGYPLDRFYGRNLALLTLEYRYALHPNLHTAFFFDEGQIFNRSSELSWLNWHRTYGLGFRLKSGRGSVLGIELGRSGEGWSMHITFGDRERRPLSTPVRFGKYRR